MLLALTFKIYKIIIEESWKLRVKMYTIEVAVLMNWINILMPTGYYIYHQFNIQQLYAMPALYLCVLYLSENKQRLVPLTA